MKIRFLKDVTADVMAPEDGTNDIYNRLMRQGLVLECNQIVPVSRDFSNIWTDQGECIVDLKNDCFEVIG